MTTPAPAPVPRQIVKLAVLTLPASQRERYRQEFSAELHFVPRADQFRYATRVLSRTWSLRLALIQPAPDAIGESTMKKVSTVSKSVRCRLGVHRWKKKWNHETSSNFKECSLCGERMGTGWPGAGVMGVGGS